MKTILAITPDGNAAPVLGSALAAARRFDAHIVGLHAVTTEYAVVFGGEMGFSISSEIDQTLEREGNERRDAARKLFYATMAAAGVPIHLAGETDDPNTIAQRVTAEWREEEGRQNMLAGALGRIFDLIVLEQPNRLASLAEATLEDALFESGRPVLMVPAASAGTAAGTIGNTIVIAWNGSSETARTIAFAVPFLKKAGQIHVISVADAMTPGPSGESLGRNLARLGVPISWRHVQAGARAPGKAILDEARALGADLLIKGAYTQSRLRQIIFGGATRDIIMESGIPVLMAH